MPIHLLKNKMGKDEKRFFAMNFWLAGNTEIALFFKKKMFDMLCNVKVIKCTCPSFLHKQKWFLSEHDAPG